MLRTNFYPTDRDDLPENTRELLIALHFEFYGGPKAHANAFRVLPRVVNALENAGKIARPAKPVAPQSSEKKAP